MITLLILYQRYFHQKQRFSKTVVRKNLGSCSLNRFLGVGGGENGRASILLLWLVLPPKSIVVWDDKNEPPLWHSIYCLRKNVLRKQVKIQNNKDHLHKQSPGAASGLLSAKEMFYSHLWEWNAGYCRIPRMWTVIQSLQLQLPGAASGLLYCNVVKTWASHCEVQSIVISASQDFQ